jgi:O-antigen ligase
VRESNLVVAMGSSPLEPAKPLSRWDGLTAALCGVVLQYVWRVQEVFPQLALARFTTVVSVGAIVLFALDTRGDRRLSHLRHKLFRPMLAILILAVLSVPMSLHIGRSFQFLTANFVKTVILAGVLAASIRDRRDVDRLLRTLVLGGAGYMLAALILATPDSGRLEGVGGRGSYDPNDLGLFAVSTIPLCVYLMRGGARWRDRFIGLAAAVLLLVGLVESGSRGGFIAFAAVSLYGLLGLDAVRKSKRLAIMVVALLALAATTGSAYWGRMSTILNPQADYNWSGQAQSGRMEIWRRGVGYMVQHPLLGVGVNAFPIAEGNSDEALERQAMRMGFKWSAAHSAYVQIGAELGLFGLAAFVSLLGFAFREARKIGQNALSKSDRLLGQAFGGLVIGFAVGGAFVSQAYSTFLYLSIALLIGLSRVVNADIRRARQARLESVEKVTLGGGATPFAVASRSRLGSSFDVRRRDVRSR